MPMPVGGAFALRHTSCRSNSQDESNYDPELEDFREQQKYITSNIKCTIEFAKGVIPADKGTMEGLLVLEALEDVEHSGIFILMKGLPRVQQRWKAQQQARKQLANVKFTVMVTTYTTGGDFPQICGGSRVTYPLELGIPEELPPPLFTWDGRLIYRLQVFISTVEARHVAVGETIMRWQGCRKLKKEEVYKELKIEQQVQSKRGMLGLGRRRSAMMEWRIAKGGYLPGEVVHAQLLGECKEKGGMEVECNIELVQKVWYQVPSTTLSGKMWVRMKVNVIARGGTGEGDGMEMGNDDDDEEEGGEKRKVIWEGKLKVPKGTTPTYKVDFMNSVSYSIRAKVGVAGESKEGWVTGEVPLLIGTSKEVNEKEEEAEGGETPEEEAEDEEAEGSPSSPGTSPSSRGECVPRPRSGSTGTPLATRRPQSISFIPNWARPRAGSVSSMESCASLAWSTLSIFKLPPSYSQLSSRRQTLETLPPEYCDLEIQDQQGPPSQVEENTPEVSQEGYEEQTKDKEK